MITEDKVNLSGTDGDIVDWVWDHLIPDSGQSLSIQGEIFRAIQKLRWEAQENGNINWDACFVMFIEFLQEHLVEKSELPAEAKSSIGQDLARLQDFLPVDELENDEDADQLPYVEDDLYDRLTRQAICYCRLRPVLMPRKSTPEQYR
jgi:hypothetical protein